MFDWMYVINQFGFLIDGFKLNLILTITSFTIGMVLGVIFSSFNFLMEVSSKPSLFIRIGYYLTDIVVQTLRSISVLLVGLFLFFSLPVLGINLGALTVAIIALGLGTSALVSELLKPGFNSSKKTLVEPALALGSGSLDLLGLIIPHVLRNHIPIIVTVLITVVKDSVIFSALGLVDISRKASQLVSFDFKVLEVWTVVLLINLCFIQVIILVGRRLDRYFRT